MDVSATSSHPYRLEGFTRISPASENFSDLVRPSADLPVDAGQGSNREETANLIWHDAKETSLSDASEGVRSAFEKLNSPDRPEGLSDQEWMTQLTASMGATDSIYAYLALAEQNSRDSYVSGKSPDIIKMNLNGHIFTHAVKVLDISSLMVATNIPMIPDTPPLTPPES